MTAEARITHLFVDQIEDDAARVLVGELTFSIAISLLPPGVREGDWIQIAVGVVPAPPTDTDDRRKRLAKDDPGGTIKL